MKFIDVVLYGSGMASGHFLYQGLFAEAPNLAVAAERSFFSFGAFLAVWLLEECK